MAITLEEAETKLIQKAYLSNAYRRAQDITLDKSEASWNTTGSLWKRYLNSDDREMLHINTSRISWLPSIP